MKYAKDQSDKTLDFNGMAGDGVNRAARTNVCANPYTLGDAAHSINKGLMQSQRRGNTSSSPMDVGPSATRDKRQMTIATASQGGRINGGATVKQFGGSPDKINVG